LESASGGAAVTEYTDWGHCGDDDGERIQDTVSCHEQAVRETNTGENIKTLTRRDKEDSDIEIQTKKEDEKLKIQEYIKSRWNFCFIFTAEQDFEMKMSKYCSLFGSRWTIRRSFLWTLNGVELEDGWHVLWKK